MTTKERRAVRLALETLGFERSSYGADYGDGAYYETYVLVDTKNDETVGDNVVHIHWAPRTK